VALVVITVRDEDDDRVNINVEFEPTVGGDEELTAAQSVAFTMLEAVATPDDVTRRE